MKKSYILITLSIFTLFSLNAQNIELPDLTTVIEGENIKVSEDALPDFKDVLSLPKGSGTVIPNLPDINTTIENNKEKKININNNKTVYSEISAGGGFPFLFFGNCEVQSTNKDSPFKLFFNYESANGYNGKPLTDNFSDSNISLIFEKKYTKDALSLSFDASYDLSSKGFQNKVKGMSELNKSIVMGNGDIKYGFSNGIEIGTDVNLTLYNRFSKLSGEAKVEKDWMKENAFLSFVPSIFLNWSGNGFDFTLSGEYLLDANIAKTISGNNINRGSFKTGLRWHNDIVNAYGNVGIVFGKSLLNNSVLVPFNAGLDLAFPVYFSNRKVSLSFEGGLESKYVTVGEKEKKYSFAGLSSITSEEADWFGRIGINIPLKSAFTGSLDAEYRQTAFNNGVWEANYDTDTNNIYSFTKRNHELLTTNLSLTFTHGIFSIKGVWRANWFDTPTNDAMQRISLKLSFQDLDSKWGTSLFSAYYVRSDWEMPIISLDGFVQLTPTVRLNVLFDDIVDLFTKEDRKGYGKYIGRGFSGSVFLKFVL